MLASKTNTHLWKNQTCNKIDNILKNNNLTLFNLPWSKFNLYKNDLNHFTTAGFKIFSNSLANFIKNYVSKNLSNIQKPSIYIISDSTIDYWNYDNNNNINNKANNYLKKKLYPFKLTIDAVSGSGFCALKHDNKDFIYRLNKQLNENSKYDLIIIIGGWNDIDYSINEIDNSINESCKIIKQLIKLT